MELIKKAQVLSTRNQTTAKSLTVFGVNSKNKYTGRLSPRKLDPVSPNMFHRKHVSVDVTSSKRAGSKLRSFAVEDVDSPKHPIHNAPDVKSNNFQKARGSIPLPNFVTNNVSPNSNSPRDKTPDINEEIEQKEIENTIFNVDIQTSIIEPAFTEESGSRQDLYAFNNIPPAIEEPIEAIQEATHTKEETQSTKMAKNEFDDNRITI